MNFYENPRKNNKAKSEQKYLIMIFRPLINIGEYSAKKIYFFPSRQKNCEKISPYFLLSEVENCPKLHFFWKKLSKFFPQKMSKFALFGV